MIEPCSVRCTTNDEAKELFEILRNNGYKWCDNDELRDDNNRWSVYGNRTCYDIEASKFISYGSSSFNKGAISLQEFKKRYNLDGWFYGWIKKPGVWAYAGQEKNKPLKMLTVMVINDTNSSTIGWWKFISDIVKPPVTTTYEKWEPTFKLPKALYVGEEKIFIVPATITLNDNGIKVTSTYGLTYSMKDGLYVEKDL